MKPSICYYVNIENVLENPYLILVIPPKYENETPHLLYLFSSTCFTDKIYEEKI